MEIHRSVDKGIFQLAFNRSYPDVSSWTMDDFTEEIDIHRLEARFFEHLNLPDYLQVKLCQGEAYQLYEELNNSFPGIWISPWNAIERMDIPRDEEWIYLSIPWQCRDLLISQGWKNNRVYLFDSQFIAGFKGVSLIVFPKGCSLEAREPHDSLLKTLAHSHWEQRISWESTSVLLDYIQSMLETEIPEVIIRRNSSMLPNVFHLMLPGLTLNQLRARLSSGPFLLAPEEDESEWLIISFTPDMSFQSADDLLSHWMPLLKDSIPKDRILSAPVREDFKQNCGSASGGCSGSSQCKSSCNCGSKRLSFPD